ncbi:hypothetical protein K8I61_02935 [bacterium]|nr:hypothetical protein [bacterium]
MSPDRPQPAFLAPSRVALAIGTAIVFAIGAWAWWVSFDRINTVGRPHFVIGDFVADAQRLRGVPYPRGTNDVSGAPVHAAAHAVTSRLGYRLAAVTAVQVPFIVLLIASSAAIAGSLAGGRAAALAALFAAAGPMTVGLATSLDDLLATQASLAAAVALWLASRGHARRWIGFASAIPLAFGVSAPELFTAKVNFLICAACAGAGAIAWAWIENRRDGSAGARGQALLAASVIASIAVAYASIREYRWDYLFEQAGRPRFDSFSIARTPEALFAFPAEWFFHMAGPALALATIASAALAWRRGRALSMLPLAAWLILPMIVYLVVNKRQTFYLVAAAPATYPLAAIGLAWIGDTRAGRAVSALAVAAVVAGFFAAVRTDVDRVPPDYFVRVFEDGSHPYLYSPQARKRFQDEAAGALVARACAPKNRPVLAVESPGYASFVGIEVWQDSRDRPFADLLSATWPQGAHCLIVRRPAGPALRGGLAGALDAFRDARLSELPAAEVRRARSRLERLRERATAYRFAGANGRWALYLFENREAGS